VTLEAIERARALQTAAHAPDRSPRALVAELELEAPAHSGDEHARRRILLELLLELERARNSAAEWYVWIRDVYSQSVHSSNTETGPSSSSLSSSVTPDKLF
jgi:hypothetical protein